MPVDLHVHTTASDGALAPAGVVAVAIESGLCALAITDHDTIDGLDEALAALAAADAASPADGGDNLLDLIPGVELSVDEQKGADVHVLGLLVDHLDPALCSTLATLREAREARASEMVTALAKAGHPIDLDAVRSIAGRGSIGRVHIARALVAAGIVSTIDDAFRLLIGREAPFYARKQTLDASQAIAAIHGAGGVAVLAHPGVTGTAALPALLAAGLDGIEAYHAEHTVADRQRFAALASRHGLIVTGGSDFHGPGVRSAPIGAGGCPEAALPALRARAARYRP